MMLVKAASLTAVVISFLHWIQVSFLLLTSSVRQPPQNLWLQGWMATGIDIISQQKEQVICYLMDFAKLFDEVSLSFFFFYYYSFFTFSYSYFFFLSASSFFLCSSSSTFFFSASTLFFSSSSLRLFRSLMAATNSNLKPITSLTGTLLAVSSQISFKWLTSTLFPLPTFLSPIKVPLVLRSVKVYLSPNLLKVQCLPLSRLSLMQMMHSGFLPMSMSDWVREQVGRGCALAIGIKLPQASVSCSSRVSVFFNDINILQLSRAVPLIQLQVDYLILSVEMTAKKMGNGEIGGEEDHMNGLRKIQAKRTITKVLVILRNKETPFHNHFSDSLFFYIFQICEETRYNMPNCHNIIYKQMSNQRPFVSRYLRKQNYESMNYPSPQPFSPHRTPYSTLQQDHSANKRTLQQKQIQDLEQKVDIILEHNQKLASENAELKQRITDNQMLGIANIQKEKMSRYQMEDSEYAIRKIKSQLQNKMRENEVLVCEIESIRQANRKEADGLKIIIANLNASNDEVKLENIKLMQDVMRIKEEQESDKRLALKELQRKMMEDMARLEKEKAEELIREKQYNAKVVQELSNNFQEERLEWTTRKNLLISKLQETHNSEINDLREEMAAQFQHELLKLQEQSTQRCKNQREKAENFIRESLAGFDGSNSAENQALRQQIKALQVSLDNRKHLIKELTVNELERNSEIQNFEESLLMRRRLKEQVQSLLRENQLLKIKTAEKYEYDLREMVKIYNDKIDILSAQIKYLSDQNDRLRKNYQSQVESKIKQRRGWEIQAGSLKNLIRKLKVELHGIQEEFKLNIEGIRDQNMTFSMTLMKSMIQDRDKASFFQDQNRKLRALYDKHQAEVEVEKKQALERVKFYESKYQQLKKTVEREKQDLKEKQEMLEKKLEEREQNLKEGIRADREHLEQMISDFQEVKENLDREVEQAKEKLESQTLQLKQAHEDIQILKSKIKQNEEHIQRLRMQLQMAGVDDTQKEEAINHWKEHYQGIILKLQGDKKQLKGIIDNQNTKIEKLVFKYRMLENQLQKANVALEKKGELDRRVIELGLDQGLVKNMTEIWRKAAE